MTFQLLYASGTATEMPEAAVCSIVDISRRNNSRAGVTGMLLHAERTFLQLLEGDGAIVRTLFSRIAADPRHRNVMVLMERQATGRAFGDWQMGFRRLSGDLGRHAYAFRATREAIENRIALSDDAIVLDTVLAFATRDFIEAA